jgi:hypothetical protein
VNKKIPPNSAASTPSAMKSLIEGNDFCGSEVNSTMMTAFGWQLMLDSTNA